MKQKKYYVLRSPIDTHVFATLEQGTRWLSKIEYPNEYVESWMTYKQLSIAGRDKFEAKNIKEQLKELGL